MVLVVILRIFNGADTFLSGFVTSFLLWLVVDWYDALVIDCLWFCHSKRFVISGTEDMTLLITIMDSISGSPASGYSSVCRCAC